MDRNKKFCYVVVFFFLLPFYANAQTLATLQKDTNITWIGVIELDYCLDIDWYDDNGQKKLNALGIANKNTYKWLKFVAKNQNYNTDYECLEDKTIIEGGTKLKRYKNSDLKEALTKEEYEAGFLGYLDTTQYWIDDFSEFFQVLEIRAMPDEMSYYTVSFRVKQIIYYSKKELFFGTKPLAIAPVLLFDKDTTKIFQTPFWMKVSSQEGAFDLDNKDITWAKRTYREIPFDQIAVLKGETDKVKTHFFQQVLEQKDKLKIRSTYEGDGGDLLDSKTIESLLVQSDTALLEPDDWSNPVLFQVINDTLNPQNVKDIRIAQDWAWDAEKQQISIRFVQFSPIVSRFDDNGNFLNKGPLFHRRKGENKH